MLLEYYRLHEQPFGVTPNPRFLYHSPMHREALASLIYGIESDLGFAALIADPGTGKTTLIYYLLEKFRRTARTALIFQTLCSPVELLRYLAAELEIETNETDPVVLNEEIKQVLVKEAQAKRRVIVIIDEAQNLDEPVLETIRLLSDFETPNFKLLHIILAGQPQLAEKLARPNMAQLLQRLSMLNRLRPLNAQETKNYIEYRLNVAGYRGGPLFTPEAIEMVASLSEGIPRKINRVCFNALSLGCALGKRTIDAEILKEVRNDLDISELVKSKRGRTEEDRNEALAKNLQETAGNGRAVEKTRQTIAVAKARDFELAAIPEVVCSPSVLGVAERQTESAPAAATRAVQAPVPLPPTPAAGKVQALPVRVAVDAMPATKPAPIADVKTKIAPVEIPAGRNRSPNQRSNSKAGPGLLILLAVLAVMLATAAWMYYTRAHRDARVGPDDSRVESPLSNNPAQQVSDPIAGKQAGVELPKVRKRDPKRTASRKPAQAIVNTSRQRLLSVSSVPAARTVSTELLKKVQPDYPLEAQRSGIEGSVVVSAVIGTDGRPRDVQAVSGDPVLANSATDAISQWVYQPYTVNGKPVEVETEIVVDFRLR
jgi:TonB family protein